MIRDQWELVGVGRRGCMMGECLLLYTISISLSSIVNLIHGHIKNNNIYDSESCHQAENAKLMIISPPFYHLLR